MLYNKIVKYKLLKIIKCKFNLHERAENKKMTKEFTGYDGIFADRFRKLMEETKTTQAVLAKHLGLSRQAVSAYTDGSAFPTLENLRKICDFFKIPSDYLLGFTSSQHKDINIQQISDITGLSAKSIENLKELANEKDVADIPPISVIDFMLSNEVFTENYPHTVIAYCIAKQDSNEKFDTATTKFQNSEYNIQSIEFKRFLAIRRIESLLNDYYDEYSKARLDNIKKQKKEENI